MTAQEKQSIHQATETIYAADALLITSVASIGVDSSRPDFRGNLQ
jgi:hypothetical protein